jgi:hypothetical protein
MCQLLEYSTFVDKGYNSKEIAGYKKIRNRMVYYVKQYGWQKARLVAGGNLTEPNTESVYLGVVSLKGYTTCHIPSQAEWITDVGS